LPLPPALWATMPAADPAPLLEQLATLRLENAALRAQNAALQEQVRELEARIGQNFSALAPSVEAARAALTQAPVVNIDETGWRQEQRRLIPLQARMGAAIC